MTNYRQSSMSYTYSADTTDADCDVVIAAGRLSVSVQTDTGFDVYEGAEVGEGHYTLELVGGGGGGTLHRMPGSDMLEGSWWQGGQRGLWRIQLISE